MNAAADSTELLARKIDALLPQTQCTRCGYPACLDYAQAIARDEADINQCPPGGAQGIRELAALLGRAEKPLDPNHGVEQPARVAFIDEAACIGCTKCIQVCPVDAIIGAAKRMHTVLSDECSGCDLCLPACPVDCISMLQPEPAPHPDREARAAQYRRRYEARKTRLARAHMQREQAIAARKADMQAGTHSRSAIRAAVERAKARKARMGNPDA